MENILYNVRMHTMLGTNHSWAVVMRNIAKSLISLDNNICMKTTNGMSNIDSLLYDYFNKSNKNIDLDICYTLPRNFNRRFLKNSRLKAAIYNYETDVMPKEWAENSKYIDYAFPSSSFSKDIFLKNGWPEEKCVVIPHGINLCDFENKDAFSPSTNKSFKFLNVSIPHHRKNIDLLIDSYYDAFTDDDDVCLMIKTKLKKPKFSFESDVKKIIINAQKKFFGKNLPQIEILTKSFESMTPVYNCSNALVSASSSECFGLPMLEAISAGKIVIAPNATGHLDFLNKNNSILYESDPIAAPISYQYWRPSKGALTYMPRGDELSQSMIDVYKNYDKYLHKFKDNMTKTSEDFTWESAVKKILELL